MFGIRPTWEGGKHRYVISTNSLKINFNTRELDNKYVSSLEGGTL